MERRSTNVKGFVHFGGDVRSGVEHGIGFNLGTASTGSTAWIETISDDTNAHLGIRAQGAGTITVGTSSNALSVGGAATLGGALSVAGNSSFAGTVKIGTGATIKGIYSTTFTWECAAVSSGQTVEITLTTAVSSNLSPGDLIGMISMNAPDNAMLAFVDYRQSAVASSIITIIMGNISSTATSTESGTGRISWIDIT
jgi:hypothetical protein